MSAEEARAGEILAAAKVEDRLIEPLGRYTALVLQTNAKFNLTGARDASQFVEHILDSLAVAPHVQSPYIDIGSGAGLPGIPLALATGVEAALLEATRKKAEFLKGVCEALGLGARVVAARAEEAGRNSALREHFHSATIRAVASAPAAVELAAPFLAVGGTLILQRGPSDAADRPALEKAAHALGCTVDAEEAQTGGRRLVLIGKQESVGQAFPRRPGLAQKRPLA